jgi:hypothetical protein
VLHNPKNCEKGPINKQTILIKLYLKGSSNKDLAIELFSVAFSIRNVSHISPVSLNRVSIRTITSTGRYVRAYKAE